MAASHIFLRSVLVVLWLVGVASQSTAQESLTQGKISVVLNKVTIEEGLIEIARAGGIVFSYNPDQFPIDSMVSATIENESVKRALEILFGYSIEFRKRGKYVILKAKDKGDTGTKQTYSVSGYITNIHTGERISQATVYDVDRYTSVLTDATGYFMLDGVSKENTVGVGVSSKDFIDTVILVQPSGNSQLQVGLSPRRNIAKLPPRDPTTKLELDRDVDQIPLVKFAVKKEQMTLADNILEALDRVPVQVSLVPAISTNNFMSGALENKISINVLSGYSYGVRGFEAGGLINVARKYVKGCQVAGVGNIVGGTMTGFQGAGIFNTNMGTIRGVQGAGISNVAFDTIIGAQLAGISNTIVGQMDGVQIAGIINTAHKDMNGAQLAGFVNVGFADVNVAQLSGFVNYGKNVGGVQAAGFINVALDSVNGAQAAGFVNYAGYVNSAQAAGFVNVASKGVDGVQVAGFLNVGNKVKGYQIGLFNLADSVGGAAIGLLSIVLKGYHQLELAADEVLYGNLSFRTGTKMFYNILSIGVRPEPGIATWGYGYGIGTQFKSGKKSVVNLELSAHQINERSTTKTDLNLLSRLYLGYKIGVGRNSGISIGPTLNILVSKVKDPETGVFTSGIAPYVLAEKNGPNALQQTWVGGRVGIHF